ncbi:NAC domain containing protein [Parasponia andersonii]|uniref:NAC domain containing protein n=1 Tax=Parasponia andersonii TaxID=3476 RepID=A0A2P5DGM3_PARAD|nr:NAC domain containing protein [Parasponia andersonii]
MSKNKTFLAPGFRFHPTDVELVKYYLKRKVLGKKFQFDAIAEIDIYKYSPWDLPQRSSLPSKDRKWFFFCPRERKYASGARMNRGTKNGFWKTTGKDRFVHYNGDVVGAIKTLVFHIGRAPKGDRTDWVMHEYALKEKALAEKGIVQDLYVLCMVFQKDGPGPRNGAQYGAPFVEEDWTDDEEGGEGCCMEMNPSTNTPVANISQATSVASFCIGATSELCVSGLVLHQPVSANDASAMLPTGDPTASICIGPASESCVSGMVQSVHQPFSANNTVLPTSGRSPSICIGPSSESCVSGMVQLVHQPVSSNDAMLPTSGHAASTCVGPPESSVYGMVQSGPNILQPGSANDASHYNKSVPSGSCAPENIGFGSSPGSCAFGTVPPRCEKPLSVSGSDGLVEELPVIADDDILLSLDSFVEGGPFELKATENDQNKPDPDDDNAIYNGLEDLGEGFGISRTYYEDSLFIDDLDAPLSPFSN